MTHLTLLLLLQAVGTLKARFGTVYTICTYQLQNRNGCYSNPLTLGRHTNRSLSHAYRKSANVFMKLP